MGTSEPRGGPTYAQPAWRSIRLTPNAECSGVARLVKQPSDFHLPRAQQAKSTARMSVDYETDSAGTFPSQRSEQSCLLEDWQPRAAAAGLKVAASKHPDAFFGTQSVTDVQSGAPEGMILRAFATLGEVRDWLRDLAA